MAPSNHGNATKMQAPIEPVFMLFNIPLLHNFPVSHPFFKSSNTC